MLNQVNTEIDVILCVYIRILKHSVEYPYTLYHHKMWSIQLCIIGRMGVSPPSHTTVRNFLHNYVMLPRYGPHSLKTFQMLWSGTFSTSCTDANRREQCQFILLGTTICLVAHAQVMHAHDSILNTSLAINHNQWATSTHPKCLTLH